VGKDFPPREPIPDDPPEGYSTVVEWIMDQNTRLMTASRKERAALGYTEPETLVWLERLIRSRTEGT
jgi:hypothetical protein